MEVTALVISALALFVSGLTFWWANIRHKRALYMVGVQRLHDLEGINFALVNAGSRDVLITGVAIYLGQASTRERAYPVMATVGNAVDLPHLLAAGKAIEFRYRYIEPFTSEFAQKGTKQTPNDELFTYYAYAEIGWVDMSAKAYLASALHTRYGLHETGRIVRVGTISQKDHKIELYQIAA